VMRNIDWRDWTDSAFDESRATGKPILLSISAVWCHWCHIMDDKTYSDPQVVENINDNFIPIRVDADRNPDINSRYNMGGWPSTVFLTSDCDVLTGSTYVPPDQMLLVLDRISSAYSEQKEELIEKAKQARAETEQSLSATRGSVSRLDDVNRVLETVRSSYDEEFGGFGIAQKFPHPSALELLLFSYEQTGNDADLAMVVDTLNAMIDGEIFDPIQGGMFRYATQRDWSAPHYEKLLEDNARMASVMLDAYRITRDQDFLDTARDIFFYIENNLIQEQTGAFYGSQDADEEYYSQDEEGRKNMNPPRIDNAIYTDSNCILARTYLKLYGIGRDLAAREQALRIVGYFNSLQRTKDGAIPHYMEDGKPHGYGHLLDMAALVFANVLCSEATGDTAYIQAAKELLESIFSAFGADNGAFYDISVNRARERGLTRYNTPLRENSMLAMAFVKLADLTEDEAYRLSAKNVLDAMAGQYGNYGIMAADYALAVAALNVEPLLVTVHADAGTEEADAFIQSTIGNCGINCTVRTVEQEEGEEPAASICLGAVCRTRVTDPDELEGELNGVITERSAITP